MQVFLCDGYGSVNPVVGYGLEVWFHGSYLHSRGHMVSQIYKRGVKGWPWRYQKVAGFE